MWEGEWPASPVDRDGGEPAKIRPADFRYTLCAYPVASTRRERQRNRASLVAGIFTTLTKIGTSPRHVKLRAPTCGCSPMGRGI
jgi:hypothetical protein